MPRSSIAPATDMGSVVTVSRDYWMRMAGIQQLTVALQEQGAPSALVAAARRLAAEVTASGSPLDWWHRFRLLECWAAQEQVRLTGYRRDAWTQPLSLARQRNNRVLLRLMENDGTDGDAAGAGMGADWAMVAPT